jgi:NADPH:quinone reductase-like Zn-dependent oxidoreductase
MTTMKAVRLFEFGGPDKLVYGDHPMPEVGPGDVLVKVLATSVSRWDIKYRIGEVHAFYGKGTGHHGGIQGRRAFPMPMQLGRDVAGEVVAVGEDVTTLKPGDRVLGMTNPENARSLASIRGLGNLSGGVDLPGHTMFGGYAQFVSRPEDYWIKTSSDLDPDQGAAAMWPCATAHRIIVNRLNARMNDNILITGASGGMGTATMQLAKLAGVTIIAGTRDARKAAMLERAGADVVVDCSRDDSLQAIRAATGGEGVDAAVEYTGAPALMRLCIDALRLGGTFCPVGGELHEIPLRVIDMVSKELNVHGIRGATRNDQRVVAELIEKGHIRMPIHAVLPLAKAGEAHAMLENGSDVVGRIILRPWDGV